MNLGIKVVSLFLLVFTSLIAVVLINTGRFRSKQIQVSPIQEVNIDKNGAVERLSKVMQFRTVSDPNASNFEPQEFVGLREYLEEVFPKVYASLDREVIGDYSLLYFWEGTDGRRKPILLMSHLDVVPVEPAALKKWKHPPFSGHVSDGFVWGRGTLDIKSGAMGILEAVEFLLEEGFQPECDVYLAFGHDEEVGGANGNKQIAAVLEERGVKLQYVLDEGGVIVHDVIPGVAEPVAYVAVAEKGYFGLKLTGEALGGHSSMPPPQTAVGVVASAINQLESNPLPASLGGVTGQMLDYLGPEMPFLQRLAVANRWLFAPLMKRQFQAKPSTNATMRTTTAATMIGGGVARNVLPKTAWAVVNFRLIPGQRPAEVLEHVKNTVNDSRIKYEVNGTTSEPSVISDTESEDFKTLHVTIREVFPDVVVTPALAVVTTDSRHYEGIAENTFRFIPTRMAKEDLRRPHGINERITVENYMEIIRFFVQQIRNSTSTSPELRPIG